MTKAEELLWPDGFTQVQSARFEVSHEQNVWREFFFCRGSGIKKQQKKANTKYCWMSDS